MSLYQVGEKAAELGAEKAIVVDRWKGGAGRIRLFRLGRDGLTQVPPLIYIQGIKLQREFNVQERRVRSLSIRGTNDGKPEVKRLKESLSDFFEVPILNLNETVAVRRTVMRLSIDSSRLIRISFYVLPKNVEVGPRITVSRVEWEI